MAQTPIVIGSYCADFTIEAPRSGNDFYYYKATFNNEDYYLASVKATAGVNAETTTNQNPLRVIKSPFVVPQGGSVTMDRAVGDSNNFKEFRFKLIWNSSVGPTGSNPIIASDMRRHITWNDGFTAPDLAKTDRYVRLTTKTDITTGLLLTGSAGTNYASTSATGTAAGSGSNFTSGNPEVLNLSFSAVTDSPKIQTRSPRLMYIVMKSDFDTMTSQAVTATKQMRYLIWNGTSFVLRDLYDPDVTTADIEKCAYRLSQQTFVNINTNTQTINQFTKNTTFGIDAFTSTTKITLDQPVTVEQPSGTNITRQSTLFTNDQNGFFSSIFSDATGSSLNDGTLTTKITALSGPEGVVITLPTIPNVTTGPTQFVFTSALADKAVEEFFTNLNVTLLRLARIGSTAVTPALPVSPNPQSGTESYLGLEQISPGSTESEATSSNRLSFFNKTNLIVRDYFKFQNPSRATQFKFYDLGKETEYLWQARWPAGTVGATYAYISGDPSGATNDIFIKPSSGITQNERGWQLEYDTTQTPPGVRLRWTGTVPNDANRYVGIEPTTNTSFDGTNDSKPRRLATSLVNRADAAIFNCIQCSQIDSAGMCIPVTVNPRVGGLNQSPTSAITITAATGRSPISTNNTSFVIYHNPRGFLTYTVTQSVASPIPVPSVAKYYIQRGDLPTITQAQQRGEMLDFVFTTEGVMSDASMKNNAVFIRSKYAVSSTGTYSYLKNTVNSTGQNRVELVASNRPSDVDGFAWILTKGGFSATIPTDSYALYSVLGNGTFPVDRYLQADGQSLNTLGTIIIPPPANSPNAIFRIMNELADNNYAGNIPSITDAPAP